MLVTGGFVLNHSYEQLWSDFYSNFSIIKNFKLIQKLRENERMNPHVLITKLQLVADFVPP